MGRSPRILDFCTSLADAPPTHGGRPCPSRRRLQGHPRSPSLSRGPSRECSRRRTVASTPTGRRPTPHRRRPTVRPRSPVGRRHHGPPVRMPRPVRCPGRLDAATMDRRSGCLLADPGRLVDCRRARAGERRRRLVLVRKPIGDRRAATITSCGASTCASGTVTTPRVTGSRTSRRSRARPSTGTRSSTSGRWVRAPTRPSTWFADYVVQYCDPAFGDYVGKAVDDSDLDYDWLVPTQDVWRSGDRTVRCAAYEPGTSSLTRSLRGARK